MKTRDTILNYISTKGVASGKELADYLGITDRAVRKQLRSLLEQGLLSKIGKPPRVYYRLALSLEVGTLKITFDTITEQLLNVHFYHINADGTELVGAAGFVQWCKKRDFDPIRKASEFVNVQKKYLAMRSDGLLDATTKITNTFAGQQAVDHMYYYDFYAIEVFGKTKIGQKLLYAKQSQDKKLMKELAATIGSSLSDLIKKYNIDAVAYVPPTVQRTIQFMKVLERELALPLPRVNVEKVTTAIRVPQKTLKKLADRIQNADATFVVTTNISYKRVLVIDDAVGSGASINQIAHKLKTRRVAEEVIGFAITGSLNDFDVISEV